MKQKRIVCLATTEALNKRITFNWMFLAYLVSGLKSLESELKTWAENRFKGRCNITIDHEDIAVKGPEKLGVQILVLSLIKIMNLHILNVDYRSSPKPPQHPFEFQDLFDK